jgi:hypothetical protein
MEQNQRRLALTGLTHRPAHATCQDTALRADLPYPLRRFEAMMGAPRRGASQ